MSPAKILVIPENNGEIYSACGWIRLIYPYLSLNKHQEFNVRIGTWTALENWKPDFLITQRTQASKENIQYLSRLKKFNTKLIYDLDDDLLSIPESHPDYEFYESFIYSIPEFMHHAATVTCSTEPLAQRIDATTDIKPVVVLNEIPMENWFGKLPVSNIDSKLSNSKFRITYFGTSSHKKDWESIRNEVDELLEVNPNFEMTLIGIPDSRRTHPRITRLDPPPQAEASYPAFVNWVRSLEPFDLGLAPLENSEFNIAKSNIKALEYGALGLEVIASPVLPYQDAANRFDFVHLMDEEHPLIKIATDIYMGASRFSRVNSIRDQVLLGGTISLHSDSHRKLLQLLHGL